MRDLELVKQQPANVPCGGCTACCRHDRIVLDTGRGDRLEDYRWHWEGVQPVLDRREDGACVYLTSRGCGIHKRAPDICRRFDCRVLFLTTPKAKRRERVAQNAAMAAVYEAGKTRQHTLDA